jgi:hypothetical protein
VKGKKWSKRGMRERLNRRRDRTRKNMNEEEEFKIKRMGQNFYEEKNKKMKDLRCTHYIPDLTSQLGDHHVKNIVPLLRAYLLQRERVYRAVPYQRPFILTY